MARRSRSTGLYLLRNGMLVPSLVKAVRRGTVTIAAATGAGTAGIAAVNPANSILVYLGTDYSAPGTDETSTQAYLELTSGTLVTATHANVSDTVVVSFEVIEFWPGVIRRVQRGLITLAGVTSNFATVTAVNPAKSQLTWLGANTTTVVSDAYLAKMVLTNSTTITCSRTGTDGAVITSYQLIEWF